MKRSFLKFSGKKFITAAFISATVLFTSFQSNAAIPASNIEIISGSDSNVEFAGSTSDALIFKVNIANEKAEPFRLTIKNSEGIVLFSDSFKDTNFEKQFKILKGSDDGDRYYFTINSNNKDLDETYVISATPRTVDDVTINKL